MDNGNEKLPTSASETRPIPPRLATRRDYILATAFCIYWLLPIGYTGLTKSPVPKAGNWLNEMYRVACLFTERIPSWHNFYFQVQEEGRRGWVEVSESYLSRMEPFGHRTRLHRMLGDSYKDKETGDRLRSEMAKFIKKRYAEAYPKAPEVTGVRFLIVRYKTGEEEIAKPAGPWQRPPLYKLKGRRIDVVYVHDFKDD